MFHFQLPVKREDRPEVLGHEELHLDKLVHSKKTSLSSGLLRVQIYLTCIGNLNNVCPSDQPPSSKYETYLSIFLPRTTLTMNFITMEVRTAKLP